MTDKFQGLPKTTQKHLATIAKDAIPEGWTLSSSDSGYRIQRLDVPEDHPTFDPEKGTIFETDDAAIAHVIARSWQGSQMHKSALAIIEMFDPEEFSRMGIEELRTASGIYGKREHEAFEVSSPAVARSAQADAEFSEMASDAFQEVIAEIDARRASNNLSRKKYGAEPIKEYEAYHENQVTRMAFFNALLATNDPSAAADHARRRTLLTATPQEFFAPILEEMRAEKEMEASDEPEMG